MLNFLFPKGLKRPAGQAGQGRRPAVRPREKSVCPMCGHKIRPRVRQDRMVIPCPNCGAAMLRAK